MVREVAAEVMMPPVLRAVQNAAVVVRENWLMFDQEMEKSRAMTSMTTTVGFVLILVLSHQLNRDERALREEQLRNENPLPLREHRYGRDRPIPAVGIVGETFVFGALVVIFVRDLFCTLGRICFFHLSFDLLEQLSMSYVI